MDYIRTSLHRISELLHPCVPRVLDCLEDFRNFFVVSEPVEGIEVLDFMQSSFVRGRQATEACVASIIRQAAFDWPFVVAERGARGLRLLPRAATGVGGLAFFSCRSGRFDDRLEIHGVRGIFLCDVAFFELRRPFLGSVKG